MPLCFLVLVSCFVFLPNITSTLRLPSDFVMYVFLFLSLASLFLKKKKNPLFKWFLIYTIALVAFRYCNGILSGSFQSIVIMTLPAYVAMTMPEYSYGSGCRKYYKFLLYGVTAFFFIEVIFSLIEFWGHFHILHYVNTTYGTGFSKQFRSVALAGACLTNALIMCGLMTFILNSPLKSKIKYILWSLGFLSLLCFQGRISIIVSIAYLVYYILTHFKNDAKKNIMSFMSLIIICIFIFSAFFMGFGDRLIHMSIFDESSAGVRSRMLGYMLNLNPDRFVYGVSKMDVDDMMLEMNVLVIECFAVIHVLLFGLIFTIAGYFLYALLMKSFFKEYSFRSKLEIITIYMVVAFISNSFASAFVAMTYFFLFAKFFSTSCFCSVVPQKYLES